MKVSHWVESKAMCWVLLMALRMEHVMAASKVFWTVAWLGNELGSSTAVRMVF